MGNLLDRGVKWAVGKLASEASVAMVYRRGALSVGLVVTRGRSEYETFDDEGNLITAVTDATFHVGADELILGGSIVEPESGDRLEETTAKGMRIYEVMPSSGNRRPFARDASNQKLRIHTKLVKTS